MVEKVLYKKDYECYTAWACDKDKEKAISYFELIMFFDFKEGLRFCASTPNYHYTTRNPFKAIFRALEHESIGMAKYNLLKSRVRKLGYWQKL